MPENSDPHDRSTSPVFSSESSTDSRTDEINNFRPENLQQANTYNQDTNFSTSLIVEQVSSEPNPLESLAILLLDASRAMNSDQPMEVSQGTTQSSEVQDTNQSEQRSEPSKPINSLSKKQSETLSRLHSLVMSETDQLLSKLPRQDDPPGRLPTSIVLPSRVDLPLRSPLGTPRPDLLTRRALLKFFGSDEIPFEFRRQNPKNARLPLMPLSDEGVRKALLEAARHISFFAKALRGLQGTDSDYSVAFGCFREEFVAFRRLSRFAVRSLKERGFAGAAAVNALEQRLCEVEEAFAKLEFASLCHKMHRTNRQFVDTVARINRLNMVVWSVYK